MDIKKLLMIFAVMLFSITFVNAFEFDNVKDYDPSTKTATITNAFGLGETIAEIKLESEGREYVHRGYNKVAQFEVRNYGDYDEALKLIEFQDRKSMIEMEREYDFKYWGEIQEEVREYETVCGSGTYDKELDWVIPNCNKTIKSISYKTVDGWADLESINLKKDEVLTIAIFTDVQKGDDVEWIPTFYGEKIEEWAVWTESLNVDLAEFINCSSTQVMINSPPNDLVATGTPEFTENATSFGLGASCYAGTGEYWTINNASYWNLNTSVSLSLGGWIYRGGGGGNIAMGKSNIGAGGWDMGYHSSDYVFVRGISAGDWLASESGAMVKGNWFFVMITKNTTNTVLYINGTRDASATAETPPGVDALFQIGLNTASAEDFEGYYDEWGFWTRDLLPSEIVDIYNEGIGMTYTDIFFYPPTMSLSTPINDTNSSIAIDDFSFNMTFNADDWFNLTFNIWDSTGEVLELLLENGTLPADCSETDHFGDGVEFECIGLDINADEDYTWGVLGCNDVDLCGWATNFTFTIDGTAPVIQGVENVTNQVVFELPVNTTWNYTVTDPHLRDCWYNSSYNATITNFTCNTTIYTQWETQGEKFLYYWANDTFDNEVFGSSSLNISLISTDYYHTPDITGELGDIFFELYVNKTDIPSSFAYLFINNTLFNASYSIADTDHYYFNYTLTVPVGWGNTTGVEHNYSWNYTIAGFVDNLTTQTDNVTVYSLAIDDCSVYGDLILNLSLYDEEHNYFNLTATSSMEIDLGISQGSSYFYYNHTWPENNGSICVPSGVLTELNYTIDWIIGFSSTDRVHEFHYLDQGVLANSSSFNGLTSNNLYLMDLLTADSTSFLFNYFDADGLVEEDIIVHVYRKYIGEGVFREVERAKQNDDGDTIVHLVEEDVIYYFIVSQNGSILYTSNTYTALCQDTPCEIQLEESGGFQDIGNDWDLIDNGGYNVESSSATREVNMTYALSSASTMNLTVYALAGDGSLSPVGSEEETGTSGSVSVIVPVVSGNTTFFASVYQDGTFIKSSYVDFEEDAGLYFGNTLSLFLGALIILSLGLMAVTEGSAVIIFLLLGMFLAMVLGLIDYRTSTGLNILIYFIIAGSLIVWKLTRRNR